MPLYEYECQECKSRFEKLIYCKEAAVTCAVCGSSNLNQLLSVFSVGAPQQQAAAPEAGPCGSCGAAQRGMCGMAGNR